jgi:outer membrane lipoprotein carrier protein
MAVLAMLALVECSAYPSQGVDVDWLVEGLEKKYSRMKGLAADFVQLYHAVDGRTLRESGHLLLKRPGKARWEYTSPERKLFISDGSNVYFYVFGETSATRASRVASRDPQIPFLFLLGRGPVRRGFSRIEIVATERPIVPGNLILRLVPIKYYTLRRAPDEFKQLLIEVNPRTFEVRRLIIFERNGARMDFQLTNVRENFIAPDAQFTFSPPPGVTIKQAS